MKKRTITVSDIPEIKKTSVKEKIYRSLENKTKTFTQLADDIEIKSMGNLHTSLKLLINDGDVRKIKCKCCNASELYEIIE